MQSNDFKLKMLPIIYQVRANVQKFIEPIVQSEDLSMIQTYILFGISEGSITNISSLCKEFCMNQGNVSTMCKQMEKEGLIKRNRSSEDERVVTLSITEHGEDKIRRLNDKADEFNSVFEQVPTEKLEAILNGMNELSELLKLLSAK